MREELRKLTHEELVARAASCGVERVRSLNEAELIDAIVDAKAQGRTRRREPQRSSGVLSWLGVARDLVARVVERGLHLPEAAQLLRGAPRPTTPRPPPPLPTVTLAEIYAAQGYVDKATSVLDEVLAQRPDHAEALALRERLQGTPKARVPARAAPIEKPASPGLAADGPVVERPIVEKSVVEAPVVGGTVVEAPVEHYDVDELVALPTDPHTAYAYWELRPLRFAKARGRDPQGRLVLRVLSVRPHGVSTEVMSRDLVVDELVGDRLIRDLPAGSELRLCLGWAGPAGFLPLVVGTEIKMPHAHRPSDFGGATPALIEDGAFGLDALGGGASARALRAYMARVGTPPSFSELYAAFERDEAPARVFDRVIETHAGGASELSRVRGERGERSGERSGDRGGASELIRRNPAVSRG